MNRWIFTAGVLSVVTFFIHVIVGEQGFHTPALHSNLLPLHKSLLSVIWHGTSGMLALNALALLWTARQISTQKPLVLLVVAQYSFLAAVFVFYGLANHGSLLPMPQWIILLAIPALALVGLGYAPSTLKRSYKITDHKGEIK